VTFPPLSSSIAYEASFLTYLVAVILITQTSFATSTVAATSTPAVMLATNYKHDHGEGKALPTTA
jgi:hypothetical protein